MEGYGRQKLSRLLFLKLRIYQALQFIGSNVKLQTVIRVYNIGAKGYGFTKYHCVQEFVLHRLIKVLFVKTRENYADYLKRIYLEKCVRHIW